MAMIGAVHPERRQAWSSRLGLTNAKIQLRNPRFPDLGAMEFDALADTGAVPW